MINISKTSQTTKIYLVTNCFGDPNKVYIGKTKNCRKSDHKKTFGKQITYDYIDKIESLDRKIWKPLECFWIEYFRQFGFDLQNENNGGGGPSFHTEETKNNLRLKIYSNELKLKMSQNGMGKNVKPIIQYDLEGNFI